MSSRELTSPLNLTLLVAAPQLALHKTVESYYSTISLLPLVIDASVFLGFVAAVLPPTLASTHLRTPTSQDRASNRTQPITKPDSLSLVLGAYIKVDEEKCPLMPTRTLWYVCRPL